MRAKQFFTESQIPNWSLAAWLSPSSLRPNRLPIVSINFYILKLSNRLPIVSINFYILKVLTRFPIKVF
jgi:hypothetical protein